MGYQNIRMLNCVKKGETEPFTLFNREYSDEIFEKCLITNICEDSIALEFGVIDIENKSIAFEIEELSDIIPLIEKDLGTKIINLNQTSDYFTFNYDHNFKCLLNGSHTRLGKLFISFIENSIKLSQQFEQVKLEQEQV